MSLDRITSILLVNQQQITLPSTENDKEQIILMLILLKRLIKLEKTLPILHVDVFKMIH